MMSGDNAEVAAGLGTAGVAVLGQSSDRVPERDWRLSEQHLWVQLAESRWQRAKLAGHLQAVLQALTDQAQLLQKREQVLGRSRARREQLVAEQSQAACSPDDFAQKRHQGQRSWEPKAGKRPEQGLQDKTPLPWTEVERTPRCLDQWSQQLQGPEPGPRAPKAAGAQERGPVGSRAHAFPGRGPASSRAVEGSAHSPDPVFLQEQLQVLAQVNERLSEYLVQSRRRWEACREQLKGLRTEQALLEGRVQALEAAEKRVWLGVAPAQATWTPPGLPCVPSTQPHTLAE